MLKSIIAVAVMTIAGAAAAQTAAPASATKLELAKRVLQLWDVDSIGLTMLQQPVIESVGQARIFLQNRAAPEKRDVAIRDIKADATKFMDEMSPVVRKSTEKFVPTTAVPLLTERFSEEELRQLVAILESPVKKKFEAVVPELQKSVGEKVAADTRPAIDPKIRALTESISGHIKTAMAQ